MPQRSFGLAIALLQLLVLGAGCAGTERVTVTAPATTEFGPPGEVILFGHIESLVPEGDHFVLRFDPAWFLSGETANDAAAEDRAVEPGQPVPNDNYVVEEGHRLLAYKVRDDAGVTVLTRRGDPAQVGATRITVAELAKIVGGLSRVKLFEPLDTGVWITVDVDVVRSIDQQYRP